jgi:hypothetical protein
VFIASAAFLATVGAAFVAWRAYRKQARQVEILEDDKRQEMASKFGVWIHWDPDGEYEVRYHNGAHLPVYNVWVEFTVGSHRTKDIPLGHLGPSTAPVTLPAASEQLTLTVDEQIEAEEETVRSFDGVRQGDWIGFDPETRERAVHELFTKATVLALWFTDGAGKMWLRRDSGELLLDPTAEDAPPGYRSPAMAPGLGEARREQARRAQEQRREHARREERQRAKERAALGHAVRGDNFLARVRARRRQR